MTPEGTPMNAKVSTKDIIVAGVYRQKVWDKGEGVCVGEGLGVGG